MVFEKDIERERDRHEVMLFVQHNLKPGVLIGKQREALIKQFCTSQDLSDEFGRGLNHLVTKFDRVKKPEDMVELLSFALWLKDEVGNFKGKGSMVYLADQKTPLKDIVESMKANYTYWSGIFGKELFTLSSGETTPGLGIAKSWLPLEGYYLMMQGGSGSGTFSVDFAIGFDERADRDQYFDTRGQIWRVGIDLEKIPGGERVIRIIRTGSGHKSQGDDTRKQELAAIRDAFLDEYQVSAQRILLFLTLELAYTLGFDKVKGLSTQGAMDLGNLRNAKRPPDYTASLVDVGFIERPGNWHEITGLQERFYEILANYWHEDSRRRENKDKVRYDVHGYTAAINAFNELKRADGNGFQIKLAENADDLDKAWQAYKKIHDTILERGTLRQLHRRERRRE